MFEEMLSRKRLNTVCPSFWSPLDTTQRTHYLRGSCVAPKGVTHPRFGFKGACELSKSKIPGDNLLSRCTHYHRPWMLNGRVRNGNGCGHPGMVAGRHMVVSCRLLVARAKLTLTIANRQLPTRISNGSDKSCLHESLGGNARASRG